MPTKAAPRFYFNLRSPYSWLAQHDLLERYPDVAAAVEWRPFWEPDIPSGKLLADAGGMFPYTPMSRDKHLYILTDVRRLSLERGLKVAWPIDREPCWEISHLPWFLAERAGVGQEYVAAVSKARWERAENICDPATIVAIGDSLGLDATAVRAAIDDPALREQGRDALLALYRDGVFGVPFFILGREKYWGIDRLGAFVEAVRAQAASGALAPPATARPEVSPAAFDDGHAGGCG